MRKLYDENDELRKEFKDTFSHIHASEDLKARTLTKMLDQAEAKGAEKESGSSSAKWIWHAAVPAAALLCAALILVVLKGMTGTPYLMQMEDGVFYEEVKLKDGEIHFVANRVAVSIAPNLGGVTIGQKQDDASDTPEAVEEIVEEKKMDGDARLICKKISGIDLPDIGDKNWSYIGEQKIYVTVLDTVDTRYQAVFEKDGQAYEVIGIEVWQKEFIDYLYRIVKRL